jgi:flagellin-specific chaperone FliS
MIVSNIMRIRQQIEDECQAAKAGMEELAVTASHEAINARYRRLDELHTKLAVHIGSERATNMITQIYNTVMEDKSD